MVIEVTVNATQCAVISCSQSGTLLIVSNTHIRTIAECRRSVYEHIGIRSMGIAQL